MRIEEVLKELQQEMTIILVTNLVQQARRLADRTMFLWNGEIVELDQTEVIFSDTPRQPQDLRLRERDLRMSERPRAPASRHARSVPLVRQVPGAEGCQRQHQARPDHLADRARAAAAKRPCCAASTGSTSATATSPPRARSRSSARTSTIRTSRWSSCARRSAWSSSGPNPLPISVYENVVFGLRIHSERKAAHGAELDEAVEKRADRSGPLGRPQGPARRARPPACSSSSSRSSASPACCRSSPTSS